MKDKDEYTLEELYNNLAITITELSRLADMSEGTIRRIRRKLPARRSTANKLLQAFSKAYNRDLSLDNVTGIALEEKEEPDQEEVKSHTATDGKRAYTTAEDIPTDWVLCSDFFEGLEIKETTYRRWLRDGLAGEKLEFEERPRPGKADKYRYFTPSQQEQALDILKRHGKVKTPDYDNIG